MAALRPYHPAMLLDCSSIRRRRASRGLSYVELLVATAVLAVLATAAIPTFHWIHKRRAEARLEEHLFQMRRALDQYHELAVQGLIQMEDVEQAFWPRELDDLVEGVVIGDPQSPESKTMQFLHEIPVDPTTGEREWGLRSWQDDWDSRSWGGENVYDVYSLSERQALDGTYYKDW